MELKFYEGKQFMSEGIGCSHERFCQIVGYVRNYCNNEYCEMDVTKTDAIIHMVKKFPKDEELVIALLQLGKEIFI